MEDKQEPLTKVSHFTAMILTITSSDIRHLTWLMIGIFFLSQLILRDFRIWYYGASFVHWTDWALVAGLAWFYYYYTKLIGTLYLSDFYDELEEFEVEEPNYRLASEDTVAMTNNMAGIEDQVVALYMQSGEEPTVVVASMAKLVGSTMVALKTEEVKVDFSNMKVKVTVIDLEE